MDIEPTLKNKFWNKKRIIWTVLGVIAIAFVAIVLIQKYRIQKAVNEQANIEKAIFERMEALTDKNYVLSPKDSEILNKKMENLTDKNYVLSPKDSEIINNRIKNLSQ